MNHDDIVASELTTDDESAGDQIAQELIAVVDDAPAVLASVGALLGAHGFRPRCFATAEAFLAACPLDSIGCLITDLRMPGIDGIELQRRVAEAESTLAVVVVTGHADVPTAVRLMENGVVTLLEKPYDDSALLRAVRQAITRSRAAHSSRRRQCDVSQRLSKLSEEERRVLDCLLENKANKTIAFELGISLRTVDRRRRAVLDKMRVASVPELAALVGSHRGSEGHSVHVLATN